MIIVKSGVTYAITDMTLWTDAPAPPAGQMQTLMYQAFGEEIPAEEVREVCPQTYRGTVTAYADATRTRVVDQFRFSSPVTSTQNATKAVLDWLVTDRLAGGVVVPSPGDPFVMDLSGGVWTVNPAKLETKLIALCKKQAEAARMKVQSPGAAKSTVYASKVREVAAWEALGSTEAIRKSAYAALTLVVRLSTFTYAAAEAAAAGEADVAAAIGRMKAGLDTAKAECARLEAVEQISCRAIKAATTAAAKQAAFDGINWSWKQT